MKPARVVFFLALLGLGFTWPDRLAAQTTGSISGRVSDESKAVVPGVSVSATSVATGVSRTVVTDHAGSYHFVNLAIGEYELTAGLTGFQPIVQRGIHLAIGSAVTVDLVLKLGTQQETLEVVGSAQMIDTTQGSVAGVVDLKKIQELPLEGRSFERLALLEAGVSMARAAGKGEKQKRTEKISIAGGRPWYNSFLLDGSDVADRAGNTPGGTGGQFMGVETVQEFRVHVSNYSADMGRAGGGVINIVTKSGANKVFGSLFEFLRNDRFDAANYFDNKFGNPKPEFKRNQFGGSIGGPIRKNKTFFFGAYEGLREREGFTKVAIVPDENARRGLIPNSRTGALEFVGLDAGVAPYLNLYPLPTPGGRNFGNGTAERVATTEQPVEEDFIQGRIDHNFTSASRLFGRYTISDSSSIRPTTLPEFVDHEISRNQYLTIEYQRVASSTLVATTRLGFNRSFQRSRMDNLLEIPESLNLVRGKRIFTSGELTPGSGITPLGESSRGLPFGDALNQGELSQDVSKIAGKHTLKTGALVKKLHFHTFKGRRDSGEVDFASLTDFLNNRANRLRVLAPGGDRYKSWIQTYLGLYIQDDVKVASHLLLNLGFRYEYMSNPKEKYGRAANLDNLFDDKPRIGEYFFPKNPSARNFGPRLGFAWDFTGDGRGALRGGFGVFHENAFPKEWESPANSQPPFATLFDRRQPNFPVLVPGVPLFDRPGITGALDEAGRPARWSRSPYSMHYNLTLTRELWPGTVVTLGYLGNRSRHLPRTYEENPTAPAPLPDGTLFFPRGGPRINPRWGEMRAQATDGTAHYNALLFSANRRFGEGLSAQVSYTFSRNIDQGSGVTGSFLATGGVPDAVNPFDPGADKGLSNFHVKHNFVANFSYDLPFGPGRRLGGGLGGVAGKLLEGWMVNAIWTYASGNPFSAVDGLNRSDSATCDTCDRPNVAPGASTNPILGTPDLWFDPTAFVLQPRGFLGDLGRNTLIGPDFRNVDVSLVKTTGFGERGWNVQFRAEFFNVLNRANFGLPNNSLFDRRGDPLPTVGRIEETITPARQVQLGLRLTF